MSECLIATVQLIRHAGHWLLGAKDLNALSFCIHLFFRSWYSHLRSIVATFIFLLVVCCSRFESSKTRGCSQVRAVPILPYSHYKQYQ